MGVAHLYHFETNVRDPIQSLAFKDLSHYHPAVKVTTKATFLLLKPADQQICLKLDK